MTTEDSTPVEYSRKGTLAAILEKGSAVALVPERCVEHTPKALIILLDHLSPEDKDVVDRMPHLVIDLDEDLIRKVIRLEDENVHLKELALIDDLTGLYNSRYFLIQLDTERARTRRTGFPCCLLMIDLDNFKALNDGFGHLEGNRLLREVGRTLREEVRPTDIVCRYGGDEFTVIMPATRLLDSMRIAERLKTAIWKLPKPEGLTVSASIGIVEYTPDSTWGLDELIRLADAAMYDAKNGGKNRVSSNGDAEKADAWSYEVNREEKEALFPGSATSAL